LRDFLPPFSEPQSAWSINNHREALCEPQKAIKTPLQPKNVVENQPLLPLGVVENRPLIGFLLRTSEKVVEIEAAF
jgi:hypothetical protein